MKHVCFIAFFAALCLCLLAQNENPRPLQINANDNSPNEANSAYVPVHKFDPKRDAVADIQAAIAEAQRTGKRIVLDVGGDWCAWCHVLEGFWQKNPDVVALREKNFVMVAIFYSLEDKNVRALGRYPKVEGIPHFFVLEKDGTFLYSQGMLKLETGGEPDPEKIKQFLLKWAPVRDENTQKLSDVPISSPAPHQ